MSKLFKVRFPSTRFYSTKSENDFFSLMALRHARYDPIGETQFTTLPKKKIIKEESLNEDDYLTLMAKRQMYNDPTGEYFE